MLSKELELTLNTAFQTARQKRHEFMTVEHLLLSLLNNKDAVEVLQACGVDMKILQKELSHFLEETTPKLSLRINGIHNPPSVFNGYYNALFFMCNLQVKKK